MCGAARQSPGVRGELTAADFRAGDEQPAGEDHEQEHAKDNERPEDDARVLEGKRQTENAGADDWGGAGACQARVMGRVDGVCG